MRGQTGGNGWINLRIKHSDMIRLTHDPTELNLKWWSVNEPLFSDLSGQLNETPAVFKVDLTNGLKKDW